MKKLIFGYAIIILLVSGVAFFLYPTIVLAATDPDDNTFIIDWEEPTKVLLKFFILAIVFESALTVIFKWSIFIKRFGGKGVKTPVTFAFILLVIGVLEWKGDFGLNLFKELIIALQSTERGVEIGGFGEILCYIVTTLFIAGGSNGVLNVLSYFHVREERKLNAER